jgi:hypothetical protein
MAKQKGSKQPRGQKSPSRQRSIAMGLTQRHKVVRMERVRRRLTRLAEKYESSGTPSQQRKRAARKQKIKEVIATFKPKVVQ